MSDISKSVQSIINEINNSVTNLRSLNLPNLGPDFKLLSGEQASIALAAYRATKYWTEQGGDSPDRATKSVAAVIEYDEKGLKTFSPTRIEEQHVKHLIYKTRHRLHDILNGFKLNYNEFDFPSGETFVSSGGDVSLLAKLRDPKQWTCTPDAYDMFSRIVFNNTHLKRCAMVHIRNKESNLSNTSKRKMYSTLWGHFNNAFEVFNVRFKRIVTFVFGSRIATVPKDLEKDRVINVEPFGNMICQRCIAYALKKCFRDAFGYDLNDGQQLHQDLIADSSNATIDFSNASNSHFLAPFKFFFPKRVVELCMKTRSEVSYYKGTDTYVHWNMLSPMGNGFTFEVMTIFLMAMARELDNHSHVFGDDVIIANECASWFIETLSTCGWVINEEKTFVYSKFRESCGAFYHDTTGYLSSFKIEHPGKESGFYDCMVILNKMTYVSRNIPDSPVKDILKECVANSLSFCPAYALRSIGTVDISNRISALTNLDKGVWCSISYFKKMTRDNDYKVTSRALSAQIRSLRSDYQVKGVQVLKIPVVSSEQYRFNPIDHVKSKFWIAYYMWNNRTMLPQRRKIVSKWETFLVYDNVVIVPPTLDETIV